MSIISWTSPRPSEAIFPTSIDTSRPSAGLLARSSSPNSLTSSPRFGAGTARHCRNAAWALSIARLALSGSDSRTQATISPVMGERAASVPPMWLAGSTPSSPSSRATSAPSLEWSTVSVASASDIIVLSIARCRGNRRQRRLRLARGLIIGISRRHRHIDARQNRPSFAAPPALRLRLVRGLAHGAVAPVRGEATGRPAAAKRDEQRRGVGQPVGFALYANDHGRQVGGLRVEQRELIDLAFIELLAHDVETGFRGFFGMRGRLHRARVRLQRPQRIGDVLEC